MFSFSRLSTFQQLSFILILKALLMITIIFYAGIGLGPDEAQYWTWSRALDWGYYSKPPGIAWQIWLGTQLFGQTEWGVRSMTVLLSMLQAFTVYRLALSAGLLQRTAFWCSLFMAFSPLGMLGSLFAITDIGFLLCWTCACIAVVSALHQNREPNPLSIGICLMVGALFKWPIYLFWVFVIICRPFLFSKRSFPSLLGGITISLLGLAPSIWWSATHDWATFRHVFATVQGGSGHRAVGNVGEFLGSQALLISPVLFILLIGALWQWWHQRKQLNPAIYFCGFVTLSSLTCVTLLSCFQKIQGNWMIFAYPTAFVILSWNLFQEHSRRAIWGKMGLGLSLGLTLVLTLLPSFYLTPILAPYAPPYRLLPFKHNIGWNALNQALTTRGYDPEHDFLLSDKYQTSSILSFYGAKQQRAYFLNLQGMRNNQFSYWPSLQEERQGQKGYFVWIENSPHLEREAKTKTEYYQHALQRYFKKVEVVDLAPLLYEGDKLVKGALIFRCEDCKNLKPADSVLY